MHSSKQGKDKWKNSVIYKFCVPLQWRFRSVFVWLKTHPNFQSKFVWIKTYVNICLWYRSKKWGQPCTAIFNKLNHFPCGIGIPNYWTSIESPLSIHKETEYYILTTYHFLIFVPNYPVTNNPLTVLPYIYLLWSWTLSSGVLNSMLH